MRVREGASFSPYFKHPALRGLPIDELAWRLRGCGEARSLALDPPVSWEMTVRSFMPPKKLLTAFRGERSGMEEEEEEEG